MSYIALGTNQLVSYSNLQDGVSTGFLIPTGTTIPSGVTSSKWINKSNVLSYVNIDTGNSTYGPKSPSQWIAKQDLSPVESCGVSFNPYAGVSLICNLGTTSGTVTLTTDYNLACVDYTIYYPATLAGAVLGTALTNGSTFTFTYSVGSGTNVLVIPVNHC